ncbi:hypothetical protein LOZ53_001280 [Ophidiomyces ophidiicola]|nr:hypothetical protein LOZ53_001280 [Ophidiomyces ophidiicola]
MSWLKKHPLPPKKPAQNDGETKDSDNESIYSNEDASNRGHGTDDTLDVTRILEGHGIPCCLVGIAALVFYGAGRLRDDWEICVPTDLVPKAAEILQSEPYSAKYRLVKRWPDYEPLSLIHTYHRFKTKGIFHYFFLVPSIDVHIDCVPSNFTRSLRGLPYPKLDVCIQSYVDTNDMVALCDIIDGTNVSEEWGDSNLDLEGTTDVQWAKAKNKRGEEFDGKLALFAWDAPKSKRELWQSLVRTKEDRLDWTKPKDIFITQYRLIDGPDPWTQLSDMF